jgi:hypothetical protein
MSEQPNKLPIDMANTVISEQTEKQMIDLLQTSKRARVDHKKEWYVKECGRLEEALGRCRHEVVHVTTIHNKFRSETIADINKIDKPSIRFALGLLLKAIKQGRW